MEVPLGSNRQLARRDNQSQIPNRGTTRGQAAKLDKLEQDNKMWTVDKTKRSESVRGSSTQETFSCRRGARYVWGYCQCAPRPGPLFATAVPLAAVAPVLPPGEALLQLPFQSLLSDSCNTDTIVIPFVKVLALALLVEPLYLIFSCGECKGAAGCNW